METNKVVMKVLQVNLLQDNEGFAYFTPENIGWCPSMFFRAVVFVSELWRRFALNFTRLRVARLTSII